MARAVCSICGEPQARKMASFYWNWTSPTGLRMGYKQLVDAQCSDPYRVLRDTVDDDIRRCAHCGDELHQELTTDLYCTSYVPGRDREDWMVEYHLACFEQAHEAYTRGATRLPDRNQTGSGAPRSPGQGTGWESWDQQGVVAT